MVYVPAVPRLLRVQGRVPYELTEVWVEIMDKQRAAPGSIWDVIARTEMSDDLRVLFERGKAETDSPFALPRDIIFPPTLYPIPANLGSVELPIEGPEDLACLQTCFSGAWQDLSPSHPTAEIARELIDNGLMVPRPKELAADFSRPGIYRLQHASVLVRSESCTIVTDPVFMSDGWASWAGSLPPIDVVLISHSHGDHFALGSLLQFPKGTIMVVPRVEEGNILAPNMAELLRDAGFTDVRDPLWNTSIEVNGTTIHVLPFYGEQPWVSFPAPVPHLRSAGNTYLIDTGALRAWLLFDCGAEFGHTMPEVAHEVIERIGEVDVLMGNMRVFCWYPTVVDGSGAYGMCFSVAQLDKPELWPWNHIITLGDKRYADIIRVLQPRFVMPYAHWWHEPTTEPHAFSEHGTEKGFLDHLEQAFDLGRTRTRCFSVGDHASFSPAGVEVRHVALGRTAHQQTG